MMKKMTMFPHPFGGITHKLALEQSEIILVMEYLADGCHLGHRHNIAVEFDAPRNQVAIYTTELGVECIRRVVTEDILREIRETPINEN